MLNGFKNPGRVALFGAQSEIGLSILDHLPSSPSREVLLVGRAGDFPLDVTDKSARILVVDEIFNGGDLDCAIIAFGLLGNDPMKSSAENLLDAMEVNYLSTVHLIELIAERMKQQAHGTILVISSFAQVRPRDDNFGYGSTKAGLDFYARGLAASLGGSGVTIKILRPGFVKSKMTEGMAVPPFAITSKECGSIGAAALTSQELITWAPSILKYISVLFRALPASIFRNISKR